MAKIYKIWVEVEEIDEENDYYESLPLSFTETAIFDKEQDAVDFATILHNFGESLNK